MLQLLSSFLFISPSTKFLRMQKRQPTPEDLEDAARLKRIFNERKRELGLTQEILGERMGFAGQSAVSHYLNGIGVLNISSAIAFADHLGVTVGDFSPRLQIEIDRIAQYASGVPVERLSRAESDWPFKAPRTLYDRLSRGDKIRLGTIIDAFLNSFADAEKPRAKSSRAA